jgi:hypothetical protein
MIKVSTGRLRSGDKVHFNGVVILLGDKPIAVEHGREIIFRWPNMPIVAGKLDFAPTATVWTIQGSTKVYWRVSRTNR